MPLSASPQWSAHKLPDPLTACLLLSTMDLNSGLFHFCPLCAKWLWPVTASEPSQGLQHKIDSSSSLHSRVWLWWGPREPTGLLCVDEIPRRGEGPPETWYKTPQGGSSSLWFCGGFWREMPIKTKFPSRAKQDPRHGGNVSFCEQIQLN